MKLKLFLEGIIIGLGKIIPGVSGAVLAMMFGVYETLIESLSSIKSFKKNIKFMCIIGVEIFLSIIFGSSGIKYLLDNFYVYTMMFFMGMMASGIPSLISDVKKRSISKKHIIVSVLVVLILLRLMTLDYQSSTGFQTLDLETFISLIVCGILDAISTIVPGISGTAVLMLVGYYDTIITSLSNLGTLTDVANSLLVLLPFFIGMTIGIVLISKVINYLFKHHSEITHLTIIGFSIFSIFILFLNVLDNTYTMLEFFISVVYFIIGFISVYLIEAKLNKRAK